MSRAAATSRRAFLKTGAALSGGLVLGFSVPGWKGRAAEAIEAAEAATGAGTAGTFAPNAFLRVGEDGSVTVLLAHSEMGQGIWTGLAMLIAEELDAEWSTIRVEHAPADAAKYGSLAFGGMQLTGGSTSTRSEFVRYRQAGAAARSLLVAAASRRLGVSVAELSTDNGAVVAGKQRLPYGDLAAEAAGLEAPDPKSLTLKSPEQWRLIGRPTLRLDTPEKTHGRAPFGMDVQLPDMKTATVARSPVFGGRVKSFDASAALAIPGVRKVLQVPTGIAVVADHFWAAKRGRDALDIEWNLGSGAQLDSAELRRSFSQSAATPGLPAAEAGDVQAGLVAGTTRMAAEYAVPYLAHAPMEPLNCTVRLGSDQCEIWAGTQFQTGDQLAAAQITGLDVTQIKVHTTFLGGGFGRRATPTSDFVGEAIEVAKAAKATVKTVWERADDIRGGYYRSAFVHRAEVALGSDGWPLAWNHVLTGQSIAAGTALEALMVKDGIDQTSVEGVSDSPYLTEVPNHRVGLHSPTTDIPVLWWRSVGHSHSAFAVESLVDEMAHAAGRDPVAYRQHLLKNHPRPLGVLNLAAEKAAWGSTLPAGHGRGVAVHESFGSFVAMVAEVSVQDGAPRIHRIVCAVDCGIALNPETIAAQMESGIVFALSAALYGRLTLREGRVQESNFHDYQVLRMHEMPRVVTHVVPSSETMGGIGEVAVPPTAPAVSNALFQLTGHRLRELPLALPT